MIFRNCWKNKDKRLPKKSLPTSWLPLPLNLWLAVQGILQKLATCILYLNLAINHYFHLTNKETKALMS